MQNEQIGHATKRMTKQINEREIAFMKVEKI